MSEELSQRGLLKHGLVIGGFEYYNVGATTLKQLKVAQVIPKKEYGQYGSRKPDALVIDRRNKRSTRVVLVIEHKDQDKFRSNKDRKEAIEECNDLAQVLDSDLGIATDGHSYVWFNPRQPDVKNTYLDRTTGIERSYTILRDEAANPFIKEFIIDQKHDESDLTKLNPKTRLSIEALETARQSTSPICSQLTTEVSVDPTSLATQIWQDVWSVTGATPEKCLYTFVELFIFKYLSDLGILSKDDNGNDLSFETVFDRGEEKAFLYYSDTVRTYLKVMFPPSTEDGTTIINGTVLDKSVPEHRQVFYKILKRFKSFGPLKSIDPNFKSRVFEEFMKETISKKNWGQFFTPRKIIDAIIEISDIDTLPEDALICDPACGVGGFILEPLKVKPNGVSFYYEIQGKTVKPRYNFVGFDKGFQNDEQLVIILAKANMLIFLSELIQKNPSMVDSFAIIFNATFKLLRSTILGTLASIEKDKYDLILTNPPYVTSGSSNYKDAIKKVESYRQFYSVNAVGVEGLFLEWIIRSLKPAKKAFVIIPDGILNRTPDERLRAFIKKECIIDAILSLPVDAFYRNHKKTYILCITKKSQKTEDEREANLQTEPVFTYLVSNVGETLDAKRFQTPDKNDLYEMVAMFNQFKGAKNSFVPTSKRVKIQPIDRFDPALAWSVDRWWTRDEKVELGAAEEIIILSLPEFREKMHDVEEEIHKLNETLKEFT